MTFDFSVSLGDVLQLGAFVLAIAGAYFKLDKRIALVENELKHIWKTMNGEE